MKVVTVIGTRPETIRLSRVIAALDLSVDHIVIHTGQNYDPELGEVFFKELGISPSIKFGQPRGEVSAIENIGYMMSRLEGDFVFNKADAILILGDTNSCL